VVPVEVMVIVMLVDDRVLLEEADEEVEDAEVELDIVEEVEEVEEVGVDEEEDDDCELVLLARKLSALTGATRAGQEEATPAPRMTS